jgi:response regulator RpfG family c-di-GMP phosphodiesterase
MTNEGAVEEKIRILVVDDEKSVRTSISRFLSQKDFQTESAASGEEALEKMKSSFFHVALVDLMMPGMSGLNLMARIKSEQPEVSIIVITALDDAELAARSLEKGAERYLVKPINFEELLIVVNKCLESARLRKEKEESDKSIDRMRNQLLEQMSMEHDVLDGLRILVTSMENRSKYLGGHSQRVAGLAEALAMRMGLPGQEVDNIRIAALYCNIGKLAVMENIVDKEEPLTEDERNELSKHPAIGVGLLKSFIKEQAILDMVRYHHEFFDGTGIHKKKGKEIPTGARIIAVCDTFVALTGERPHRKAFSPKAAMEMLWKSRGRQYDPAVVNALFSFGIEQALQAEESLLAQFPEESEDHAGRTPLP